MKKFLPAVTSLVLASLFASAQTSKSPSSPGLGGSYLADLEAPVPSGDSVGIGQGTAVGAGYDNFINLWVEPAGGWTSMSAPTARLNCSSGFSCTTTAVNEDGSTVAGSAIAGSFGNLTYAVDVFERPSGGWVSAVENADLTDPDTSLQLTGVSISKNTVVVIAENADGTGTGTIDVFVEPAGGWQNMTPTARLSAKSGAGFYSVQIRGNTIVAGGVNGNDGGMAYVFVKPAGGWKDMNETAVLSPTDSFSESQFGLSVGIDQKQQQIIVGSLYNLTTQTGAGYVFVKPPSGWVDASESEQLIAKQHYQYSEFGSAAAINGKLALIGDFEAGSMAEQGYAYGYVEPSGGWGPATESVHFRCPASSNCSEFGTSLGILNRNVIVGSRSGGVFIYGITGTE